MVGSRAWQRASATYATASDLTTGLAAKADTTALRKQKVDTFTTATTTTWTCPAGVTKAKVSAKGGGGNGGASGSGGSGGGGGEGGEAIKYFDNLVPGTAYSLTVGAQGAASTFTGPGAVTLTGNAGGNGSSAGANGIAGAGGTATGGDINIAGQGGQTGYYTSAGAIGGTGGGRGGGKGANIIGGQLAGSAGAAPGAGGGGSAAVSGTNTAGGAGQPGHVIIEY